MSERKAGWYWVQMEDVDGWIPWEWIGESNLLKPRWYNYEEPTEIGPRIPTPDEPWQCVPCEATPEIIMASYHPDIKARERSYMYQVMVSAAPKP